MRAVIALLLAAAPAATAARARRRVGAAQAPPLRADACVGAQPQQTWTLRADGRLQSGASAALCATPAASLPLPDDGTYVAMAPCDAGNAAQVFALVAANNSLVLAGQRAQCLNLQGYGTSPGTVAWLYSCSAANCKGNCDWRVQANGQLLQPESGLCLSDGTGPLKPRTCEAGSPSAGLPFCDFSLPFGERVDDLYARLSPDARLDLFTLPINAPAFNATLNLLSFFHDITCIQGLSPGNLSPAPNVTVFPNAIAQAASFDTDLVARISRATAHEGRVVNQINYRLTGGTTYQGVHCDVRVRMRE